MVHTLIVEDNQLFRRMLESTLLAEFPGMAVGTAGSAEEAWQRIERKPPDIVFVDIRLPGQNGLEFTKRVKDRVPDTIVIILTSYDLPEYRAAARRFRCDHFFLKGTATNEDVVILVKSILSKRKIPLDQKSRD